MTSIPRSSRYDSGRIIVDYVSMPLGFSREAFSRTIKLMISRHAALRIALSNNAGSVRLSIDEDINSGFTVAKFNADTVPLDSSLFNIGARGFDLFKAPLFRFVAVLSTTERWTVAIACHHLVADGRSMEILKEDIHSIYREVLQKTPPSQPPKYQYDLHIVNQHDQLRSGGLEGQIQYWRDRLSGVQSAGAVRARPSRAGPVDVRTFSISGSSYERLVQFANATRSSMFTYILHSLAVALTELLSERVPTVETTFSGRTNEAMDACIGYFSQNAFLTTEFLLESTKWSQIKSLNMQVANSLDNQDIPTGYLFKKRIKGFGEESFPNRNFRIKIQMQNFSRGSPMKALPDDFAEYEETEKLSSRAMRVFFVPYKFGLLIRIEYRRDIFTRREINSLVDLCLAGLYSS